MCGVVGIAGKNDISGMILASLDRLSYRGYDSSGIAISNKGNIQCIKAPGKLKNLYEKLSQEMPTGRVGIGHTRWATHGLPSELHNAHPHVTHRVAVAHNGVIENFQDIKLELAAQKVDFSTETDSEVIPKLITHLMDVDGLSGLEALRVTMDRLEGSMSIVALFADSCLIAAKKHSSLVLGYSDGCTFASSDKYAIERWAAKFSYLEDYDIAVMSDSGVQIFDKNNNVVVRNVSMVTNKEEDINTGGFAHFMLKEICEQPGVLQRKLTTFNVDNGLREALQKSNFIRYVGCGSAHYACRIGQWYMENLTNTRTTSEIASEFRYGNSLITSDDLSIFVSQSGETADTIAAVRHAKKNGSKTVAVVNVIDSTLANEADYVITTNAGREISVASTKAFTAQLAVLYGLAASKKSCNDLFISSMQIASECIAKLLDNQRNFYESSRILAKSSSAIYMGRGVYYTIALEGALKLREIAYVHAEAIAAGELKHGSIALIDSTIPVIAICPSTEATFSKIVTNIQEVKARGGYVIAITDENGSSILRNDCADTIIIPSEINHNVNNNYSYPIVYSVAMQLLAYYAGVHRNTDIDQPRNLAKSVTVE